MLEEDLKALFQEYCRSNGLTTPPFTAQHTSSIFDDLGIRRAQGVHAINGSISTGIFLYGVVAADADIDADDFDPA